MNAFLSAYMFGCHPSPEAISNLALCLALFLPHVLYLRSVFLPLSCLFQSSLHSTFSAPGLLCTLSPLLLSPTPHSTPHSLLFPFLIHFCRLHHFEAGLVLKMGMEISVALLSGSLDVFGTNEPRASAESAAEPDHNRAWLGSWRGNY